jgi:15-cis-phytoene synthase
MPEDGSHVMELVRQADPDRYHSVLYAPESKRAALFALYAFNAEAARVRDAAREPMAGEIRLQWWRDVIAAGTAEAAAGHPVAGALLWTIDAHRLPPDAFQNYLDARVFDLYDDPMPDRTALEGYCGETASALIQLSCLVLDPEAAPAHTDAAGHGGCAQAIAGLMRLLPQHRARGQCYVPADILAAAGVGRDQLVAGEPEAGLSVALAAMTALGREHQAKFEQAAARLPPTLRAAFLPMALTPLYLSRLEAAGTDALQATPHVSALRRQWRTFRRAVRGW